MLPCFIMFHHLGFINICSSHFPSGSCPHPSSASCACSTALKTKNVPPCDRGAALVSSNMASMASLEIPEKYKWRFYEGISRVVGLSIGIINVKSLKNINGGFMKFIAGKIINVVGFSSHGATRGIQRDRSCG